MTLINDINNDDLSNDEVVFCYAGTPSQKGTCLIVNNIKVYQRDRQTSINALAHAYFLCEINNEHPSFLRKKSKIKYTEPHHLVPMSYSDKFDVSLDVEENIVSLCSNCHNQFHYGDEIEKLLSKLYNERKADLELVGIYISFNELVEMYK